MGHEPRGFIAMKQNGIFHHGMMKNAILHHGMMKNVILHHGMMKNAILHHGVMKNGICSMVSDAKLCNNVANYGTNTYSRIGFQKMSRNKRQLMKMPCILNLLMPDHINRGRL